MTIDIQNANVKDHEITLPPYAQFLSVKTAIQLFLILWTVLVLQRMMMLLSQYKMQIMQYEWEPIAWDADCEDADGEIISGIDMGVISEGEDSDEDGVSLCPGDVTSVNSLCKVNIMYFALGWFGGEGTPIKSTITIPDTYNYDSETGKSRIDIPTWAVYAMPSADQDYGYVAGAGIGTGQTWTGYGDSSFQEYGFGCYHKLIVLQNIPSQRN